LKIGGYFGTTEGELIDEKKNKLEKEGNIFDEKGELIDEKKNKLEKEGNTFDEKGKLKDKNKVHTF